MKFNKTYFLSVFFLIILISFSYGLVLVDEENFNSYTLESSGLFITESGYKWNCLDITKYPHCTATIGSGLGTYNYSIQQRTFENDDKYLYMEAIDGSDANYKRLELKFNHTDYVCGLNCNFSYSYDIKLNDVSTLAVDGRNYYFRIFNTAVPYSAVSYFSETLGQITDTTFSNHTRLRDYYNTATFQAYPQTSNCVVSDGFWHNVVVHLIKNSTGNYYKKYVDSVECSSGTRTGYYDIFNVGDFYFQARAGYSVGIDNIKYYADGLYFPVEESTGITQCPSASCLYYDDFNYLNPAYEKLSDVGYIGTLTQDYVFFENSQIFFNASADNYPYITHNLLTDSYNEIEGYMIFNINYNETPEELSYLPTTFLYTLKCGNFDIHNINIAFLKDEYFTGDNLTSVLHFYSGDTGQPLGTYTINNLNDVVIRFNYDDISQKINIQVQQNEFLNSIGFSNNPDFSFDYNTKGCSEFSSLTIKRRDLFVDDSVNKLIGLNEFWLYGINTDLDSEDTYNYDNVTSLVSNDLSDTIKENIYSFGFKSSTSRFLLIIIICVVVAVALAQKFKDSKALNIMIMFSIVCIFVLAYYLELISIGYFITIMFLIALMLAYFITSIFKQND